MKKKSVNKILVIAITLATVVSCKIQDINPSAETATNLSLTPDWTDATHGNKVTPNYDEVFPENKVNTIEIIMTEKQWDGIKLDMVKKGYGEFNGAGGGAGAGGGGGVTAPGGNPNPVGGVPVGGVPVAGVSNNDSTSFGNMGHFKNEPLSFFPVSVKYNDKQWYNVGFRLKGQSSLYDAWGSGIYKLPFKLQMDEFEKNYPEITNQRFYGFKELKFSPNSGDPSLIRDKIVSDLFRSAGIPTARTSFCKVYINFGQGLKYCGVYTLMEAVEDKMVKTQFGNDNGNLYKPDGASADFSSKFDQNDFEKMNNQTTNWSDIQNILKVLHSPERTKNPALWRSNLEKVFNMEHFLRYLAINNTIDNWDAYGVMEHNYYLYNHPTKKMTWIPWDFNLSMNTDKKTDIPPGALSISNSVNLDMKNISKKWPLIRYLADDEVYFAKYRAYLKDFITNNYISSKMNAIIDQHYNLISPYVIGTESEQKGYTHLKNPSDFTSEKELLKHQIAGRISAANEFLK